MSLFNTPISKTLDDQDVLVIKIPLALFDDAIAVGAWFAEIDLDAFDPQTLHELESGNPVRDALERLIAGSISLPQGDAAPVPLTVSDVRSMPVVTVAEAVSILMEVNADFFIRSLPALMATAARMHLTGSQLLSTLSAPGTASTPSGDTRSLN